MYEIVFTKNAGNQLKKLDGSVQEINLDNGKYILT